MDKTPSLTGRGGWSRIVVIEDDADVGRVVRGILELEGYEVILTEDGLRGLAAVQRQRPDAIVLDLMMPVMDGFEVLRQIRADERTKDVPVIVLTAMALADARDRAEASGADAVITKPFDAAELSGAVAHAVSVRG